MRIIILLHFFLISNILFAQLEHTSIGARSQGMAQIQTIWQDASAIFNNVGQLGKVTQKEVIFAYDYRFQTLAFQNIAVGYTNPFKNKKTGVLGFGIERFGDAFYNEMKIGLGYGINIENAGVGVKINYVQQHYQDLGSRGNLVIEIGSQVRLHKNWSVAASAYNLNNAILKSDFGENLRIPTILRAGILYEPLPNIKIAAEVEKDLRFLPRLRIGAEYEWKKSWFLRTGFSQNLWSAGLGWKTKKWTFDYALQPQNLLGFSKHLSIQMKF